MIQTLVTVIKEDYSLDLCPECMSKFDKFMAEGKFGSSDCIMSIFRREE